MICNFNYQIIQGLMQNKTNVLPGKIFKEKGLISVRRKQN